MRPLNRLEPKMQPQAYKTYEIRRPLASHWRDASCAEVDCPAHLHGWSTRVDVSTELGARQANYIRLHSGRRFTVKEHGNLVIFTFGPGQRCFRPHRVPLEREPLYLVRRGDHRGDPTRSRPVTFRDGQSFVDDFGEHQTRLADRLDKG